MFLFAAHATPLFIIHDAVHEWVKRFLYMKLCINDCSFMYPYDKRLKKNFKSKKDYHTEACPQYWSTVRAVCYFLSQMSVTANRFSLVSIDSKVLLTVFCYIISTSPRLKPFHVFQMSSLFPIPFLCWSPHLLDDPVPCYSPWHYHCLAI